MSLVASFADITPDQIRRNPGGPDKPASTNYPLLKATPDTPDAPMAFLAEYPPDDSSCPHFHSVDQFQILVKGKGELGRHAVQPYFVHFARAYTPYGPLHADRDTGWTFMTLRARYDPGAQRLPGALPRLREAGARKPWQVTTAADFPPRGPGVSRQEVPAIRDDQGLFVHTLAMAPGTRTVAPAPSDGAGQFIVVVKGSLLHQQSERKALSVVFVRPDEEAYRIEAGPEGLDALILNFPRVTPRAEESRAPAAGAGLKKWRCVLCSFFYDEALGLPDEGIPAGTRWADVPASWSCPDCGASKSDFEMEEVPA